MYTCLVRQLSAISSTSCPFEENRTWKVRLASRKSSVVHTPPFTSMWHEQFRSVICDRTHSYLRRTTPPIFSARFPPPLNLKFRFRWKYFPPPLNDIFPPKVRIPPLEQSFFARFARAKIAHTTAPYRMSFVSSTPREEAYQIFIWLYMK